MADVKVQSRYSTTYTTPMSDSQVTMDVAVAPANTKGFLTIRYGYSDQEDVYYGGVTALQLTGLLRGLSPTALTPTEVVGLKKAHTINAPTTLNTVKMMTVHYVINNKPNVDGDETISGNWSFTISPILPGLKSAAGYQVLTITNEATPVNYLDIKASATGAAVKATATGTDTDVSLEFLCKGSGVIILPDKSELKTSAAPTADNHIANKKYVDDKISLAEATTVQVGTQVETTDGARNYINPKSTVKTPATYTPAYLTGDNTAEGNYLLWLGTADGSFAITINGTLRTVSGIDFTVGGLTSMALIAAHIQTALRAVTGGLETVAWSTDHFIITSGNTTPSSAITVTSATGSGTDISGAGAFGGLGCDSGHGTVTAKVLNPAADENKIPIIGATGQISPINTPIPATVTADAAELNKLDGTSANVTATNLNTLTAGAGSDANSLHKHNRSAGAFTWNFASDKVVAHGLGVTPNWIKLKGHYNGAWGGTYPVAFRGKKIGSSYSCIYVGYSAGPTAQQGVATDAIGYLYYSSIFKITVTADSTDLTFAISGDPGDGYFDWECGV